jgi:hypothetical protein
MSKTYYNKNDKVMIKTMTLREFDKAMGIKTKKRKRNITDIMLLSGKYKLRTN